MSEPITYDVPEGAMFLGQHGAPDIAVPAGHHTVATMMALLTASLPGSCSVVELAGGGIAIHEPFTGGACSALGWSEAPRPRPVPCRGTLDEVPTARRHHHPRCRWIPGKTCGYRGWSCDDACPVPALHDEEERRARADEDALPFEGDDD